MAGCWDRSTAVVAIFIHKLRSRQTHVSGNTADPIKSRRFKFTILSKCLTTSLYNLSLYVYSRALWYLFSNNSAMDKLCFLTIILHCISGNYLSRKLYCFENIFAHEKPQRELKKKMQNCIRCIRNLDALFQNVEISESFRNFKQIVSKISLFGIWEKMRIQKFGKVDCIE